MALVVALDIGQAIVIAHIAKEAAEEAEVAEVQRAPVAEAVAVAVNHILIFLWIPMTCGSFVAPAMQIWQAVLQLLKMVVQVLTAIGNRFSWLEK